jgi:hypothetical protein
MVEVSQRDWSLGVKSEQERSIPAMEVFKRRKSEKGETGVGEDARGLSRE